MVEPGSLSGPAGTILKLLLGRAGGYRRTQLLRRGQDTSEVRSALEIIVMDGVSDAAATLFDDAETQEFFKRMLLERDRDAWPLVNGSYPTDLVEEVCEWVAWTLAPPDEFGRVPPVGPDHLHVEPLCAAILAKFEHWALRAGSASPLLAMWTAYLVGPTEVAGADLFDANKFPSRLTDLADESLFDILQFKHRAVPFIDDGVHGASVDATVAWARKFEDKPGLAVGVMTGPAGTGKSRLAAEICDQLVAEALPWRAGFADYSKLPTAQVPTVPTLVVCDYPERHPEAVGKFLEGVWQQRRDGLLEVPVSVLLVSRHQESWYEPVRGRIRNLDRLVSHRVVLRPTQFDDSAQALHAQEAFTAFCDGYRIPEADRQSFELDNERLDRPLLVHSAALLAARRLASPQSPAEELLARGRDIDASELLDDLIEAEVERLIRLRIDGSDDGTRVFGSRSGVRQALCVTTLTTPLRCDLPDLLACTEAFGPNGSGDRIAAADALSRCFPAAGYSSEADPLQIPIAPVEPDLVAGRLLDRTPGRSQIVDRLVVSETVSGRPSYLAQLVGALTLAADDYPSVGADLKAHLARLLSALVEAGAPMAESLGALLAERLPGLVDAAVASATEQDLTAARELTEAMDLPELAENEAIDEAAAIAADRLPHLHPGLASLGKSLASRAVAHHRRRANATELARAYNTLGNWLSHSGRHAEGLAAAERAVALYEELVEINRAAYLPDLAGSVNNLAVGLAETGHSSTALASSERAVALYEELVEINRAAYLPDLAGSVNNLAVHMAGAGRRLDGLAAAERVVAMREELVEINRAAYLPDLAGSVNNLAVHMVGADGLSRRLDGLAAAERAVALYEELVEINRAAYLPDLAMSVNNLTNRIFEVWRRAGDLGLAEQAASAAERMVTICEELAQTNRAAYLPDLARALWMAAKVLPARDVDLVVALVFCDRAIELYRELAEAEPGAFGEYLAAVEALRADLTD